MCATVIKYPVIQQPRAYCFRLQCIIVRKSRQELPTASYIPAIVKTRKTLKHKASLPCLSSPLLHGQETPPRDLCCQQRVRSFHVKWFKTAFHKYARKPTWYGQFLTKVLSPGNGRSYQVEKAKHHPIPLWVHQEMNLLNQCPHELIVSEYVRGELTTKVMMHAVFLNVIKLTPQTSHDSYLSWVFKPETQVFRWREMYGSSLLDPSIFSLLQKVDCSSRKWWRKEGSLGLPEISISH